MPTVSRASILNIQDYMKFMHTRTSSYLLAVALAIMAVGPAAAAAGYPSRPIQIIVHVDPGSAADIFARELGKVLAPVAGQPVIVVNRVGGNGAVQMAVLKASTPDGYTIGVNTTSHLALFNTSAKGLYRREDFAWIARLQLDPFAIYVSAGSPIRTLRDFVDVAHARARGPGPKMSVGGSLGIGGAHNIAFNIFAKAASVELNWVAVPGTAATMVMGGHVDAGHGNLAPIDQLVKAGKLRVLGISTEKRLGSFPDVPTYREAGYAYDTRWIQVRGLYAHKDVPAPVQERLVKMIREATRSDAWQKYMRDSNQLDGFQGTQEYTQFVAAQESITADWLKRLGVVK